ncbi:hypothetical protein [uncultured Fretibacterium sp.]|uniref:hypothetical protein n=1 Tax=uncultured Fretibacterium sp. TaxID=1678694 RepID=UPI0026173583|nr:hypothetical protein [uncultured Fretibacterium sp.]
MGCFVWSAAALGTIAEPASCRTSGPLWGMPCRPGTGRDGVCTPFCDVAATWLRCIPGTGLTPGALPAIMASRISCAGARAKRRGIGSFALSMSWVATSRGSEIAIRRTEPCS